jgi:hypothetical protein
MNPTSEYRGTPFWSWNNKLDVDQLKRQILTLKDMGFGGYHMHCRTGLDTEYMGSEFLDIIKQCVEYGEANDMLSWLYDEDRWPSGAAGGLVTKEHKHRVKSLLWTCKPYGTAERRVVNDSAARVGRSESGDLLAVFEVIVRNGALARYRVQPADPTDRDPDATVWYAYLETASESSWFNNQAYVDTLSRDAIERFIEVIHKPYHAVVGSHFGKSVPAIFTDEPQFAHKQVFATADDTRDLTIPFTTDFFDSFEAAYGARLQEHLPELFWDLSGGAPSVTRYRYHDHVSERFATAFADTIGKWCEDHGIALTGHMMGEASLHSQTSELGEAMRSYRSFHIPGIDMLCDWREYSTAKQAQSAAHQYGRPGVLSELYGVTNWDFDFVGHKAQGDWQAALGVTVRVPHLAWVSMKGEAKRDYPAAIGYQSPWYKEYSLVEDHFARLNTVLTRGNPVVRVGVIHPIESYWLAFGPSEQTALQREELESQFKSIIDWLLFGLIDFDFIAESLLPSQCRLQVGDKFHVGEMAYDVVIVPGMRTIRGSTLIRLERFVHFGGTVIFAGEVPTLVDAEPSSRPAKLAEDAKVVNFSRSAVIGALKETAEVEVQTASGAAASTLLHQIRDDNGERHVFLCNTDRDKPIADARVRFRGSWRVLQLDTFTGGARRVSSRLLTRPSGSKTGEPEAWTEINWTFPAHGDLLVTLTPGTPAEVEGSQTTTYRETSRLASPVPVTLSEPNVLVLDLAEWRAESIEVGNIGPEWEPREELLRVSNLVRAKLDLPPFFGNMAQPWVDQNPAPIAGYGVLRFAIDTELDITGAHLAIEDARLIEIKIDDVVVDPNVDGYWTDEAIETVPLPPIAAGRHELTLRIPVTRKTNIEWAYLLGDFGVEVTGSISRIVPPVRQLSFGDWTTQGLPFYAGNVTYHLAIEGNERPTNVKIAHFKAPLLSVDLDGQPSGKIAFAPYTIELGQLSQETHTLDVTAFGNRVNSFGQLHLTDKSLTWFGPGAWRTEGDKWAYEYQLKPMGILAAPIVEEAP